MRHAGFVAAAKVKTLGRFIAMSRVLVTGANGFIGAHLVRALVTHGDDVSCLVRIGACLDRIRDQPVRLCYGDVTQPATLHSAVRNMEIVYHLAGATRASGRFQEVNSIGTGYVAQVCAEQTRPPVLVLVSSLAAAGPAPTGRVRHEIDRPIQVSQYGRSKRAGELNAQRFAHRVPITVIRPPIVLGEMDRVGLDLFRCVARYRVAFVPGLARHRHSVIHARDLAQLLILAAERGKRLRPGLENGSGTSQGYYFAASEANPSFDELGRMIAAALEQPYVLCIPVAMPLVWLMAGGGELLSRLARRPVYLNLDKAAEVTAGAWVCSGRAACEELGFRVGACLQQRIRETATWYRQVQWLE